MATAPYEDRAEEVTYLLAQCGLARYLSAFRNDDVDDSCLNTLTPEDLHDLGLPMGPRVRLARAIRERNAAAAAAAPSAAAAPAAPSLPPPPPLPVSMRAATPPPFDNDDDDDDLCQMCWDNAIDCKCKHCEKAFFCSACVANWRRQGTAKAQGSSCPTCRQPEEGQLEVVDLEGRPLDAPRAMAWGGAAPAVVPFPGAAEAEARRRREAEARAAADADALRRRREAEAVRARERREAEMYAAAAEAEARRRREAEARAALNAAALATSVAAKDAGVWASRASEGRSAVREEAHRRARVTKPSDVGGDHAAYVDAYVAAVTGAFEDAAAAAAARVAQDAANLLYNAVAAVASVLDEAIASCCRDAAAAAIAEEWELRLSASGDLSGIEREILTIIDEHGGEVRCDRLLELYREHTGKDMKKLGLGRLSKFLLLLPGVAVVRLPADSLKLRDDVVVVRRCEAAEARLFVDVECMILMLVDAHGGEVRTAQLVQLFRRHYGKELDYKGLGSQTLSKFLMRLPGVSVVHLPGDSLRGAEVVVRRRTPAEAPAPSPASAPPSRSASPDPAAAPWTPPAAAAAPAVAVPAFELHPGMYCCPPLPPGAYFMPPPPMFYVPPPHMPPPPMPPMSQNPFVLQPIIPSGPSRRRRAPPWEPKQRAKRE